MQVTRSILREKNDSTRHRATLQSKHIRFSDMELPERPSHATEETSQEFVEASQPVGPILQRYATETEMLEPGILTPIVLQTNKLPPMQLPAEPGRGEPPVLVLNDLMHYFGAVDYPFEARNYGSSLTASRILHPLAHHYYWPLSRVLYRWRLSNAGVGTEQSAFSDVRRLVDVVSDPDFEARTKNEEMAETYSNYDMGKCYEIMKATMPYFDREMAIHDEDYWDRLLEWPSL